VTYLRGKQDESREGSPGAHAHRWQRYCRIHLGAR
jgi:hypothetical protein